MYGLYVFGKVGVLISCMLGVIFRLLVLLIIIRCGMLVLCVVVVSCVVILLMWLMLLFGCGL